MSFYWNIIAEFTESGVRSQESGVRSHRVRSQESGVRKKKGERRKKKEEGRGAGSAPRKKSGVNRGC
ncbi:hypothetical protein VB638_02720 [Dolichospermum sp. UHCC 0684]|uniref:hypothetical protein n=1 Tax=unclassified Dolichospermum TaxID=2622029 RepID=UPI001446B79A|nr:MULTISPECIES: hypothetical protein [unclassified Dolichospermum]MEA5528512.1 hypothetical protein [Dolichospermum sp. UHCC 0684]MTJ35389.1 hypothetical protein [Dolichospermum sp. UHCC 0260]